MKHVIRNQFIFTFLTLFICSGCRVRSQDTSRYEIRREIMVRTQIEARNINDQQVLNAMRSVQRHLFVPGQFKASAYGDFPLPIGYDQTISQPYIVALMTEALALKHTDKVLEIGTGSGYQAAVLAEISDSVFSIEIIPELGIRARNLLDSLSYDNILIRIGDGYKGWPEHAPFDAIIVTAAPTNIPQPLTDQLSEGGKMIIPVGDINYQELVLLEKRNGQLVQRAILPVRFVPMVDENRNKY